MKKTLLYGLCLVMSVLIGIRLFAAPPQITKIIVLDPGHGGFDGGAQGEKDMEKDLNLQVCLLLKDALEQRGYTVVMTRDTDCALLSDSKIKGVSAKKQDMRARREIVARSGAALFLSVHMNHFPEPKYRGAQVFFNDQGREIALCLQEALKAADPTNRREAKPADGSIYLLSHTDLPACLIECGFLSNPEEETRLMNPSYQSLLAETIAQAADRWLCEGRGNREC